MNEYKIEEENPFDYFNAHRSDYEESDEEETEDIIDPELINSWNEQLLGFEQLGRDDQYQLLSNITKELENCTSKKLSVPLLTDSALILFSSANNYSQTIMTQVLRIGQHIIELCPDGINFLFDNEFLIFCASMIHWEQEYSMNFHYYSEVFNIFQCFVPKYLEYFVNEPLFLELASYYALLDSSFFPQSVTYNIYKEVSQQEQQYEKGNKLINQELSQSDEIGAYKTQHYSEDLRFAAIDFIGCLFDHYTPPEFAHFFPLLSKLFGIIDTSFILTKDEYGKKCKIMNTSLKVQIAAALHCLKALSQHFASDFPKPFDSTILSDLIYISKTYSSITADGVEKPTRMWIMEIIKNLLTEYPDYYEHFDDEGLCDAIMISLADYRDIFSDKGIGIKKETVIATLDLILVILFNTKHNDSFERIVVENMKLLVSQSNEIKSMIYIAFGQMINNGSSILRHRILTEFEILSDMVNFLLIAKDEEIILTLKSFIGIIEFAHSENLNEVLMTQIDDFRDITDELFGHENEEISELTQRIIEAL